MAGNAAPLKQFGYDDLELLGGPLRDQFDRNHAFYPALDEDRLLKPYRERAGMPVPGEAGLDLRESNVALTIH